MSQSTWVSWGPYEAATLLSVQAGLYEVQFAADGSKRWASSAELLSLSPPSSVPPQHLVLLPAGAADGSAEKYTRAQLVRADASGNWTVADGKGERKV